MRSRAPRLARLLYRARKIVADDEPVIVALNQGAIDLSDLHDLELPVAMMVLYGIGETVMRIDPYAHTSAIEVPPRVEVQNRAGSPVSTNIFAHPKSSVIAAVMLARTSVFNLFTGRRRKLLMAHNPLAPAEASVPAGVLPLRGELWVAPDRQLIHRGVVSEYGPFSKYSRRRPRPEDSLHAVLTLATAVAAPARDALPDNAHQGLSEDRDQANANGGTCELDLAGDLGSARAWRWAARRSR